MIGINWSNRKLYEELIKATRVTNLYNGNCKGCGECCSNFLPLSIMDVVRLRGYLSSHKVEARKQAGDFDCMCPFLSEKRECMVYEARPEICRIYRCDKHKDGKIEPFFGFETAVIRDMRETFCEESPFCLEEIKEER